MNKTEQKEWEEMAPFLAAMPKRNPFIVPKGFFEKLYENTSTQQTISSFTGNHENAGFTVPENYFNTLSVQILGSIPGQALHSEHTGFALPEGYFEKLTGRIMEKTAETPKTAKIIRLWSSDLMKYASAACVILVTAATLFINQQQYKMNQTSVAELYNEQMLYDIDEDTIIEHVQSDNKTGNVSTVPDAQLEDYIISHYSSREISQAM